MMEVKQSFLDEMQAIDDYIEAMRRDDEEEMARLRKVINWDACSLAAMKDLHGPDFIRERGYNTKKADKEFGPGWLDRDI